MVEDSAILVFTNPYFLARPTVIQLTAIVDLFITSGALEFWIHGIIQLVQLGFDRQTSFPFRGQPHTIAVDVFTWTN